MDAWIGLLWAAAPGIITGIVMAIFSKRQKQQQALHESREDARRKESTLNLDLTFAAAQLAYASAMALKRGHPNGEVEQGIETYEKALAAYRKFERQQVSSIREG